MARRALLAVVSILVVIFGGTLAFVAVEGWDFWRAFFFTLITVTTVGYGAEGLSANGERVTAVLLIGGIGTATFAFGIIMRWAVDTQLAWRSRMENRIGQLSGHYIICGFGRIGRTICQRLTEANLPFVVIDGEHEACEDAKAKGLLAIRGNATEDDVLISAGIERAKGIVCAVNSDSANIVTTLGAREMRPDITIFARVDEDGAARKIRRAGASHIVSPFRTGAIDIANAIIHPNLSAFLQSSGAGEGNFELSEITVSKSSEIVGQTIASARSTGEDKVVFVAIKRADGSTVIGPQDSTVFKPDDVVIIGGAAGDVERIYALLGDSIKTGSKSKKREMTTWGPQSPLDW
ncbi:MAG: potassium channel protein [Proteobacteria bacterium]|nr:potassium channel protein [Pseudomonadota bacterium]